MIVFRGFGTIGACTVGDGNDFGAVYAGQMVYNGIGTMGDGHRDSIDCLFDGIRGLNEEKHCR